MKDPAPSGGTGPKKDQAPSPSRGADPSFNLLIN